MARLKYYSTKTNAWETVDSTFGTGNVKTVNGVEPDANGNIEIAVPGMPEINYPVTSVNGMTGDVVIEVGSKQVQSNLSQNDPTQPDYVKGRTHYEENNQTVIEWDGSTDGRGTIPDSPNSAYYNISDLVPTIGKIIGGSITYATPDGSTDFAITESVCHEEDGVTAVFIGNGGVAGIYIVDASAAEAVGVAPGIYAIAGFEDTAGIGTPVGYISTVTYGSTVVHQLDEKFIPDSVARKTDVTWENLPDKPFCDVQTVIEWDGSTEGRETSGDAHYHVSGETPTVEDLSNGVFIVSMEDGSTMDMAITDDSNNMDTEENVFHSMGVCVAYIDGATYGGVIFPKAGVYFLHQDGMGYVSKLTYGSTKTIEPKFLPKLTAIADLTEAPTAEDFNALLDALRAAGYLATE